MLQSQVSHIKEVTVGKGYTGLLPEETAWRAHILAMEAQVFATPTYIEISTNPFLSISKGKMKRSSGGKPTPIASDK